MEKGALVAGGVIGLGALYLLGRSGALDLSELGVYPDPDVPTHAGPLTPQQAAALANRQAAAGNAPVVPSASFVGSGGLSAIANLGAAALPLLGVGGVALGLATAGIGLAVVFVSYELLKQRASMHTNDVRDQWQRQFIDIHTALGIRPLTYEQTKGSGPGNIEMAEVIFYFDHDDTNALWKSVSHTQDERTFRAAAVNVERFLRAQGVPVQDAS